MSDLTDDLRSYGIGQILTRIDVEAIRCAADVMDAAEAERDDAMALFHASDKAHRALLVRADAAETEVKRLREAMAWYADPERYRPHPHGIAFDRRDISYVAVAALAASTEGR